MNHAVITGGKGLREREQNDYYATPEVATKLFLEYHDLSHFNTFLEPACGEGHLVKVLVEHFPHAEIRATDLIDRGFGKGGVNFLTEDFEQVEVVITNPPFKLAKEFVEKALTVANKQVVMFAKLQFLETEARAKLFKDTPLKYVYVHSKRVSPMRNGEPLDEQGKPWSSVMCFAWFVWDLTYAGEPMIKFLTTEDTQ
ncbi:class I SAM-dependent methyltransferase [Streptococcus suis]|uniref:Class I SAM-dependent methyltransferase n=1 Tax=Streptococcus suis TaxID=1307 RepID=A0A4T2GI15_STRSU|nr:class I SAM-dependent methyltransferase [Streptococcus suis]MBM7270664.1 class I SAM-dependent methyltransferase [Streptococcus suis]TIH98151.1 class I SAM-dependent methyltransferase [Streptococcus suis]